MQNNKLTIFVLIIVVLGGLWLITRERTEEVSCTMEAKLCPDGSAVGRSGPRCEFAACPAVETPSDWVATSSAGLSFRYPASFGTTYTSPVDWPPQIERTKEPFVCTEAGLEGGRAGITEQREIGKRSYCVTTVSEGAAGSTYKQLAYATNRMGETIILTFTTREPQCANYPAIEKLTCEQERITFNLDSFVDKIVSTIE